MDVHRSRFVPYPTFPITALAFTRSNDNNLKERDTQSALRLAIGRQNGVIEIWNPLNGHWVQETVFPGDNRSIDGLAWTREPDDFDAEGEVVLGQYRLFSIASSPAVTEWDLERGQPKKHSTGNFSEVWCFATQPQLELQKDCKQESVRSQEIVAGCGDGALVLLSTEDNDLQFKKFIARVSGKRAKCVSIAYQQRTRVVAGFMDSTIRVFDTIRGTNLRTMSLGVGILGAPKNAIVWQVRTLPNGDVVSGDSNGDVVFWDGRSYTVSQRIRGHDSECLDLVVSGDGKTVISGSINGRMTIYRQGVVEHGRRSWAEHSHRRLHDGQVKAMTSYDSKDISVVVSGGDDMLPTVSPLRENGKEKHMRLPTLPQAPSVASARQARLLVSWWDKTILVWRIARRDAGLEPQASRKLVARLSLATNHAISAVAISEDGRLLAASTLSEVKLFQLRRRPDGESLSIRKLEVPKSLATSGSRLLRFAPDSKWLAAVTPENELQVIRLAPTSSKPKQIQILNKVVELERRERHDVAPSNFKAYDRIVTLLTFSSDSSVLATGDLSGYLDSWVLEGHQDLTAPAIDLSRENPKAGNSDESSDSSDDDDEVCIFFGQHWAANLSGHLLPKLESAPLILTFRPNASTLESPGTVNGNPGVHSTRHNPHAHSHELPKGDYRLWVMTARHQMYEFDILTGRSSDWSRRNPTSVLPEDFLHTRDRAMGAVWDVGAKHERLWLYGSTWMFMFNVGVDLAVPSLSRQKRKAEHELNERKRQKTSSGAGGKKAALSRGGLPEVIVRIEDGTRSLMPVDQQAHDDDGEDEEIADERLQLARVSNGQLNDRETVTKGGPHTTREARKWWYTFKYRPILGVVPLADNTTTTDDDDDDDDQPLEVVIVERPLWDAKERRK